MRSKKLKKHLKKVYNLLDEMAVYIYNFNGILAPKGDGAKQEACKEFHEVMTELHKALIELEECQLNELEWDIESIELISEMESDY